ncbi:MAG: MFS transporter [Candidatus Omnitrophota bacterium]|nr:MAG: MFS transporter [Candidatus Omnitrophota bacterium]
MRNSHFRILRKRNFFFLWLGQIISQFGDRLTQMALIGLVYRLEPGSSVGLAKMLSLAIIPVFLFSPVAGVYADRWNKQKTMYVSDALRGVFILLIPLVFMKLHSYIPIYALVFLSFGVGRFFIPAKMAIIPSLVKKKDFLVANSLVSITAMIAAVLGFGLGGIIVERWGVESAFILDASTFFLSAMLIFAMRIKEKAKFNPREFFVAGKDAILTAKNSFMHEAKEGLRYILKSAETRYAAKVLFVLFATIGSLYTVFIVFIQNTLDTITLDLGWLAVGIGAGLFLGSLLYGRFGSKARVKKTINLSLLASSSCLVLFAYLLHTYPDTLFAFFLCLLLGAIAAPIVIAVNTLIHQESENNFWGRIFSSLEVVIHLAFILFMFASSYLAEVMTPFTIIMSVGVIVMLFSTYTLIRKNAESSRI